MYKPMNSTELKAEALFQFAVAQRSGIKKVVWVNDNEAMLVFYNNGTVITNDFNKLSVQFELHGKFHVVPV